jgi:hypothetical protein
MFGKIIYIPTETFVINGGLKKDNKLRQLIDSRKFSILNNVKAQSKQQ